jgi:hypothetical protein
MTDAERGFSRAIYVEFGDLSFVAGWHFAQPESMTWLVF